MALHRIDEFAGNNVVFVESHRGFIELTIDDVSYALTTKDAKALKAALSSSITEFENN